MPLKEQTYARNFFDFEKGLLNQTKIIAKKHKEIDRITGSNYNVFKVLKLSTNETKLHSAFIADLLDPSGTHDQGAVFLKLFLKHLNFNDFEFDADTAYVHIEKFIGSISEDYTEGGIIDIVLSDKENRQVFIENKIYAGDQKNQLLRYSNYNKKALLIYLCLREKESLTESCDTLKEGNEYHVRTYHQHVLSWLEECKKEAVALPILRETLTQYIYTTKLLTGEETSEKMKQELAEVIAKDKDSFEAAFSIADSIDTACGLLLPKLDAIIKEIGNELNVIAEIDIDWKKQYSGFSFYKEEWKLCVIRFQFQNYDTNMIFGICRDNEEINLKDQLTVEIYNRCQLLGGSFNSWWPFNKKMDTPFYNWHSKEVWLAIIDESIRKVIKDKVELILNLVKNCPL